MCGLLIRAQLVIDEVPRSKRERNFLTNPITNDSLRSHEFSYSVYDVGNVTMFQLRAVQSIDGA